ncbi:lipopolysaccharide biosynthesis protein [Virgibacillus halodenitrificans]|uniref:lipopolysaccharide biosynthesis protein n=1 Tax=Virgibacillus halodenitrificans TaxID=1482 RepID=UPI001F1A0365|nr:oligosaccharide flippase family protein [Virgibacillus halodenitrificans]
MTKVFSIIKRNKFFSNSILYIVGSMMTPFIGLIMMPIYTNYLRPEEYGTMTTVQTLVGMFQLFLHLSLHGAVTRFFYDYLNDKEKQKEYIGSIFAFVCVFSTSMSLVLLIFHNPIGSLLFSNIPINPFFFYLVGLSWASSVLALPLALWRAQEKAGLFVIFNITKSILIMIVASFLIIVKDFGPEGVLLSHFTISVSFVIIASIISRKSFTISFQSTYVKNSLIFSIPLLPHVASGWIIKSSDRVILEKFVDLKELGLYSLAAQVSIVLSLFYTGVNNALVPRYTSLRKEGNNEEAKKLLRIFTIIIILTGGLSIPIAIFAVQLLSSNNYIGAMNFVPVLIIGEIIKGLYFIPVAKLFYTKSTKSIATSSIIAAVANIILNFFLIPYIGAYGAAASTIISELIRFTLIYVASKKNKEVI